MVRSIEKDRLTELVIRTEYAKQWDNPDKMGTPSLERERAIHEFAGLLRSLGMEATVQESRTTGETVLQVKHPNRWDASRLRNRGGGKVEKPMHPGSPLQGLDDDQKLEWLETHTLEEGSEALGTLDAETGKVVPVSRPTYFRRLKALRERIAKRHEMEWAVRAMNGETDQNLTTE